MESAESVQQQAYLVSRGVRPLALLDTCDLDKTVMANRFVWLSQLAGDIYSLGSRGRCNTALLTGA